MDSNLSDTLYDMMLSQFGVVLTKKQRDEAAARLEPLLKSPRYVLSPITEYEDIDEFEKQLKTRKEIKKKLKTDVFRWVNDQEVNKVSEAIEATQSILEAFLED